MSKHNIKQPGEFEDRYASAGADGGCWPVKKVERPVWGTMYVADAAGADIHAYAPMRPVPDEEKLDRLRLWLNP